MFDTFYCFSTPKEEAEDDLERLRQQHEDDEFDFEPEPLPADLYGVSISSLIKDVRKLAIRADSVGLRVGRAITTVSTLWMTLMMQVFMIYEFKRLVSSSSVHQIREVYSEYELWMYQGNTTYTDNGYHRGIEGFFNPDRFEDMPSYINKNFVCSILLSQPYFAVCILLIWSSTVVVDLREVFNYGQLLLLRTDTVSTASEMLVQQDDIVAVLRGLTLEFKALLLFCIFLPRLAIDLTLLWLGCRWLTSTADFSQVLLDTIALEFILELKTLIYIAYVPSRTRYETSHMLVPLKRRSKKECMEYMGSFVWLVVVFTWVFVYLGWLQCVLPGYRWDIQDVCADYVDKLTALHA
mmetsp:Transcript_51655/g.135629  ORF Transcript_51655/g.135629 Transcript_51655/m.135629 type:complete len:352 (+) Transcript_51655:58-1113(+)